MAAPKLARVTPSPNTTQVSRSTSIRIEWDRDIDPTSVDESTIYLIKVSDRSVVGVAELVITGSVITGTPAATLDPNETYTVTIEAGVRTLLGEKTARPFTWNFTTETSVVVPTPHITTPGDAAHVERLQLSWSNCGTVTYEVQLSPVREFAGQDVLIFTDIATTSWEPSVDPGVGTYYVRVRAIGTSERSAWSPVISVSYQTYRDAEGSPAGLGDLWAVPNPVLELTSMSPVNQSANKTPTSIRLVFNRALNSETLTEDDAAYAVPTITGESLLTGLVVEPTGTWSLDGAVLSFTGTFVDNMRYAVSLPSNLQDEDGRMIAEIPDLWFMTKMSVLYSTPSHLRQSIGLLTTDYPDAFLYAALLRASVRTNQRYFGSATPLSNTGLLAPLPEQELTLDVMDETLLRAKIDILRQRYTELASLPNSSHLLGDFQYNEAWQNIDELVPMINTAVFELQRIEAKCRTTVRSGASLHSVMSGPQPRRRRV